jgi:hypothetical protein
MSETETETEISQSTFSRLLGTLPQRVAKRVDSWANAITSMGTVADKTMHTLPVYYGGLPDHVLEALFHGDAIVRKIVTKPGDEALRKGIHVQIPDEHGGAEVATEFQDRFDDLSVVGAFREALAWEALFGGSVIYMGLDDGSLDADSQARPVAWERLRSVLWLKAIDRRRIRPSHDPRDKDQDPRSPTFGEPLWYLLYVHSVSREVRVHRSRLIVFPGPLTTEQERWNRNGWGISVLDPVYEALQRNATAWQSAGNALSNAQYVVYKLKGLMHMFSLGDGEDRARKRARAMEMAKGMLNAVLIDSDDEYIRENPNFGNMPNMLDQFMLDVSAVTDMPATVLWGRSPAGMNATGESDMTLWQNRIDSLCEHHIRPRAQQLVSAMMYAKDGPTQGQMIEGWRVYFPPRRELTEVEQADVRLKTSQADASDIAAGILMTQEVATSRYRPEGYSTETQIDIELRKKLLELESKRALEALEAPEPQPPALAKPPGEPPEDEEGPEPGEPQPEPQAA